MGRPFDGGKISQLFEFWLPVPDRIYKRFEKSAPLSLCPYIFALPVSI